MKNIKIHLLNFLSEKKYNMYKEIEFVCHNSNYNDIEYKIHQQLLYHDLIQLQKKYNILPYMEYFSDDSHEEISLAVVILDKYNEKK